MRRLIVLLSLMLLPLVATHAAVSVSIGINVPVYPQFVAVPGYPVYYAPQLDSNYFFYDGAYWVYANDGWYSSTWYNGPWMVVQPAFVPYYVLRVPVRYYRRPPVYFHGWVASAPPRWGEHWGPAWEHSHSDWNRWDNHAAPHPAPLPVYQRSYAGDRYPHATAQQHAILAKNYSYQPRETVTRQHFEQQAKADNAHERSDRPPQSHSVPDKHYAQNSQPHEQHTSQPRPTAQSSVQPPHNAQPAQPQPHSQPEHGHDQPGNNAPPNAKDHGSNAPPRKEEHEQKHDDHEEDHQH
jgi:hypothetical protein